MRKLEKKIKRLYIKTGNKKSLNFDGIREKTEFNYKQFQEDCISTLKALYTWL